jgi:hypothetical protein
MTDWIYTKNKDNTARYTLGKQGKRVLFCIGINPSTAEPDRLDPTLKRVESLAHDNNYDGWIMLNVYPQRATHPDDIHHEADKNYHKANIEAIRLITNQYPAPDILAAWGTVIQKRKYLMSCLPDIVKAIGDKARWQHLGELTKYGHPRHPLYVAKTITFNTFDIHTYINPDGKRNTH